MSTKHRPLTDEELYELPDSDEGIHPAIVRMIVASNPLDLAHRQWLHTLDVAMDITARIVNAGGMATKSSVEDELMPMFGITRYTGHDIMNYLEYHNLRKWSY